MYHSITIGTKNTWDDWHLIATSRPVVNPPTVKTSYVDLPGGDGVLDLTEVLAGRPTYNNRTGSWTFYVMNGFQDWHELFSDIMVYLQGREYDAILEDDPAYRYHGRFQVDRWQSDPTWSKIVISYNLGPYKKDVIGYGDNWLWDPFSFETGTIRSYVDLEVHGSLAVTVINEMLTSIPTIITNAIGMTAVHNNKTYNLAQGSNTFRDMVFVAGENHITFNGEGRVTIENIGGKL